MREDMTEKLNNPLRQFFRRPGVFISLPSGGESYSPEDIEFENDSKELAVYPMTAIDEITTKTPDALFNGSAVVEIIKSCVPAIKNPWNILSNDLDTILVAIKAAGGKESIDVESTCENEECKTQATFAINLQQMLRSLSPGEYEKPLKVGDLEIHFKPITYKQLNDIALKQFDLRAKYKDINTMENVDDRLRESQEALKDITKITMFIISRSIDKIVTADTEVRDADFILDFLEQTDTTMYEKIRDYQIKLKQQSTIKPLQMTCDACGHQYTQQFTLNASDFFG